MNITVDNIEDFIKICIGLVKAGICFDGYKQGDRWKVILSGGF